MMTSNLIDIDRRGGRSERDAETSPGQRENIDLTEESHLFLLKSWLSRETEEAAAAVLARSA
jgi:hypothetical protein